jgi:hypothetical protein
VSTYLGVLGTIAGAAGTVVAAVKANDVATITAGVSTIATALTTLGGRHVQAAVLAARWAPVVSAVADGLASPDLDDPSLDVGEPVLSAKDLAGREAASEPVGHGAADMRDAADKAAGA